MTIATYLEAAERIVQELETRGFTTETSENSENLEMVIAEIIQKTLQGNTNFVTVPDPCEPTDEEVEALMRELEREVSSPPPPPHKGNDGWDGDLQNQM